MLFKCLPEGAPIPEKKANLRFDAAHARVYENGWLVT